jgi:thymidine phosphorylase
LGAGRTRKEDQVSSAAGVTWSHTLDMQVSKGETLFTLHTDEESRIDQAIVALRNATTISKSPSVEKYQLILDRIGA